MNRKHAFSKLCLPLALAMAAVGCHELLMGYTEPQWTSVAKHRDGRQFVTDGNLAIDNALAQVDELPQSESSAAWFSEALHSNSIAERRELFTMVDIEASEGNPEIVVGPGELQLEESYVSYLQGKFGSGHRVAFWQHSRMQPLVIVIDGEAAGAMKVLAQR